MNCEHWIEFAAFDVPHVAHTSGQYAVDGTIDVFDVFDPIMYDTAEAVAESFPAVPVPEIVNMPLV